MIVRETLKQRKIFQQVYREQMQGGMSERVAAQRAHESAMAQTKKKAPRKKDPWALWG